jgi:spermidine synthase
MAASLILGAASLLCLLAIGPTAVWRHSGIGAGRAGQPPLSPNDRIASMNTMRRNIVWETDGRESSVAISSDRGAGFVVNGKSDGNAIQDVGTQMMLGALGVLLNPDAKSGLVIGLGTGESAGWLAHQPSVQHVSVIEIEPAIRHVAEVCAPLNHDVLRHPKVELIIGDAREVLLTQRATYDVIASEPSNPYRSGVSSLYTREFYAAVRQRLAPGGVFLQWLQGYEIDAAAFRTVLRTLDDAFETVEVWETSSADMVLVCSLEPLDFDAANIRQRMAEPAMKETLRAAWRTVTIEGVLGHYVASSRFTKDIANRRDVPINTDDNDLLEYRFARSMGLAGGFSVEQLRKEAVEHQANRPLRLDDGVDWEAVEDSRIAYHAVADGAPLSPASFSGPRSKRAQALKTFQARTDLAAVSRLWDSQPKPPHDLLETIAVAMGHAARADERAKLLFDSLRADCPMEADIIAAVLATRQNKTADAGRLFVQTFKMMRTRAPTVPLVAEYALSAALEAAQQDAQQVLPLYDVLCEPLCVFIAEEQRRLAVMMLADQLGPREVATVFEASEPFPPWNEAMLQARLQAYRETRSKYFRQAQRDLETFQWYAPEVNIVNRKQPSTTAPNPQ